MSDDQKKKEHLLSSAIAFGTIYAGADGSYVNIAIINEEIVQVWKKHITITMIDPNDDRGGFAELPESKIIITEAHGVTCAEICATIKQLEKIFPAIGMQPVDLTEKE